MKHEVVGKGVVMTGDRKILSAEYNTMSDHDLLVRLCVSHDDLKIEFSNHLHKHWQITVLALSAALTGTASFVVGIILLIAKFKVG
jgi:hypothetical protein